MTDLSSQTSSSAASPDSKANKTKKQIFWENFFSLGLALLIVFMIRSSVIEAFKIPSGSMIPTLLVGDHIFVNKFAYGFKIPFSDLVFDQAITLIPRNPPSRGDIIVFKYPKDESYYYIKRVIGVPGDIIEIRNKLLYINNEAVKRDPLSREESQKILSSLEDIRSLKPDLELFNEHINGVEHVMMINRNNFATESFEPITVPPDSLFVMGDNRDSSNDSRYWGFVPYKNVKGKALVIWLSIWLGFSDGKYYFRPTRIGTLLH
jgi:signal peptidase I